MIKVWVAGNKMFDPQFLTFSQQAINDLKHG